MHRIITVNDIVLLTEKQQVKKAILEQYDSIESFAETIGMSIKTIGPYLRGKKKLTENLKIKLVYALKKDYCEIVFNDMEQMKRYIDILEKNIKVHRIVESFEVMIYTKNICIEKNYSVLLARVNYLIGNCFYLQNNKEKFYDYYISAINILLKRAFNYDLLVYYESELAYILLQNQNIDMSKTYFSNALTHFQKYEGRLNDKTKFYFYYWYAIYLQSTGEYLESVQEYQKASKYAQKSYEIARIHMCMGFSNI